MEHLFQNQNYKVLVVCHTYNQSSLITKALNGFVMQQTDFPYACLIMDDASTDDEQRVIRSYLYQHFDMQQARTYDSEDAEIIIATHLKNVSCSFIGYFLKKNLHGTGKKPTLVKPWRERCDYVALCEGDDFWIDPLKLKKQIEWLDSHKEYTLCCSDAKVLTLEKELNWRRYDMDCDVPTKDIIRRGGLFLHTVTLAFKSSMYDLLNYDFIRNCYTGDYALQLVCAINGKVRYLQEKTAVYRYQLPGSWSENEEKGKIDKLLKNWRSVLNMLEGFDRLTEGKYHEDFAARKNIFIVDQIICYPRCRRAIKSEFKDVLDTFTPLQFFILFLRSHHLYWLLKPLHPILNKKI